jgi:hypothetical protein
MLGAIKLNVNMPSVVMLIANRPIVIVPPCVITQSIFDVGRCYIDCHYVGCHCAVC